MTPLYSQVYRIAKNKGYALGLILIRYLIRLAPLRRQHNAHGLDDQFEVGPHTAFLDVKQIQVDPLVEGDGVSVAAGLPVAGQAWFHQQALALVVVVGGHLVRQRGARSDYGHPFCQDENARQDGDFAQVERIASNFDGAFRAAWDALENRNSA